MITYKVQDEVSFAPSSEGRSIAKLGSPEARLWSALPSDAEQGKGADELKVSLFSIV